MNTLVFPSEESRQLVKTLRDDLRCATTKHHHDLEKALNLLRLDFSLSDYHCLLVKFYEFYVPLEAYLEESAQHQCASANFYCKDRLKKNWLSQDIKALDIADASKASFLSRNDFSLLLPSAEHIVGAIYVIEGSTLGGAVLSTHFKKTLGLTPERGLRFFSGYGKKTMQKWTETLQYLEQCDTQPIARANIIAGAKKMFLLLKLHLINASPDKLFA